MVIIEVKRQREDLKMAELNLTESVESTVELALAGLASKLVDDEIEVEAASEKMDEMDTLLKSVGSRFKCDRVMFHIVNVH